MTTNVPPEPDEFQTRMRQPSPQGDIEDTNQSGRQPAQQEPQPQQPPSVDQTHQFAPPGFGSASQSQPPAGYGAPAQQPGQQPAQPFGQQPFGQQSQAPQPPSFGQQSQAPQQQGWGQQQPAAGGWGQQQPATGGFAQQQPATGGFAQQQPWAQQRPKDANPLKAAFDFSFNDYATPGIVKIVYVIGIALAALWYLIAVITAFTAFGGRDYGFIETEGTIVPGILMLLFGWIPAAFFVLVLRLALEHVLSSVRTASDARVLRERSDADAAKTSE